jgi:Niemann-Pick C1 protein
VYLNSIIQTKNTIKKYQDQLSTINGESTTFNYQGKEIEIDKAYPYSLFYVYYDQYMYIQGITFENIIIALGVIFLAVQIIMNIRSAFTVTLFVFSCVLCLIGVVYLMNFIPDYKIEINALSVVNLVMGCGLSVEFTVHIIIFYLRCQKDNNVDRVRYALSRVGVSVLVGIVCTKFIGKL